jgi:oxygen-independent coproporphyrinogen-3 oxidase
MAYYDHQALPRSLYIHWPFCPYKCHFCPFVALANHDQFMGQYHQALCREIISFGTRYSQKQPVDTIYMGGGTPSTYPDDLLLDMFGTLRKLFDITQSTEITLEVNPGTVRKEQLCVWKDVGINRLSIGVQSLKDSVLKDLNRHQSVEDVAYVLQHASALFDNISVDFILGLPGVSSSEWKEFLHTVVTWPLKHISMYFLMVHEDTPLHFRVHKKMVELPCDDELVDLYHWSVAFLAKYGFMQYELSNFSQEGYQSRHNTMYWERKPFKGFGIGACSFDGLARFQNEKNLAVYLKNIEKENEVIMFDEVLTRSQVHREKIMLGIRQSRGMLIADMVCDLADHEREYIATQVVWLKEHGFIEEKDSRLMLTPKGLSVENALSARLSI